MSREQREPKLLLVDDQPNNLTALRAALEPLGLPMTIAHSGAEALRCLLHDDDFAAILLDVQMPTMDGIETAQFIKQREKSKFIPILFITAAGNDPHYILRAYGSGAVDYLAKPFDPDVLCSKVTVFVDLFRQREEIRRQGDLLRESEQREAVMRQTLREREMEQAHARAVEELYRKQRIFLREVLFGLSEGRLILCDTADDLPAPLPLFGEPIPLTKMSLRTLRHRMAAFATEAGWPLERQQDFETAVGEGAMNAVVHGGGEASGEVRADLKSGRGQVWIRDQGKGISEASLHRATLEKGFTTAGTLGHGFSIMLKTADRVYLLTGPTGTTVVLEQGAIPPEPSWLATARPVYA